MTTTSPRRFAPGDRVKLTGSGWGAPGTWSEKWLGETLTLSRVEYTESGELEGFSFVECPYTRTGYWAALPAWNIIHADRAQRVVDGHEVIQYFSEIDGAAVVEINTASGPTGRMRIFLNDAPIWNADPEKHEHVKCQCILNSETAS